jgi:two-component system chemotaxis sensor kinase CheA
MEAPELLGEFLRESEELVDALEQGVVELEGASDAAEIVNALFRAAHTLKGNAGMVGLQAFVHFTHVLENLLARVRDGSLAVERDIADALLASVDVLRAMRGAVADGEPEGEVSGYAESLQALKDALAAGGEEKAPEMLEGVVRDLHVELTLQCDPARRADEASGLFTELNVIGEVRDVVPDPTSGAETYNFVVRTDARRADVEAVVLFAEARVKVEDRSGPKAVPAAAPAPAAPAAPRAAPGPRAKQQAVLRVDAGRLDRIVDLMGEMVVAAARAQRLREEGPEAAARAADACEALETLVREAQDRVMALRMVPVRETFEKFRRPVRDAANELSKEVAFVTEGVETELDRKVLDELGDPLKHMVRNAIAHGLEGPEARVAAGKPREGRLWLRARQSEGAAIIEVQDDGAGIDRERVLAKAIERGLVQPGATLTDAQVHELLFAPGFSTAKEVSELAGRGVGLDVVKRNVEALHGSIEILSDPGKGCTWRIRLPLTLAVVDGLYARVGHETVTIPMPSIVELLDPTLNAIRTLEGRHEFVDVRGECLPVVRLRELLDVGHEGEAEGLVVVVQNERRRFGVVVDRVLGMSRAVIKPLDRSYAFFRKLERGFIRPRGVSGATVLGDGAVGLILDVHGLEAMAFGA